MKRLIIFCTLIILTFLVANFSSQTECPINKDLHAINIWGKVTTEQGETYDIENISLSGQYEDIMVYAKPLSKNTDPSNNRTPINLIDIKTLIPIIEKDKSPVAYVYKNKEYIEIAIELKQKKSAKKVNQQKYIIERDKRLMCYVISETKQKKDIALEVISKLEIKGYYHRDDKDPNKEEFGKIEEIYNKTKNLVQEIPQEDIKEKIMNSLNELYQSVNANC